MTVVLDDNDGDDQIIMTTQDCCYAKSYLVSSWDADKEGGEKQMSKSFLVFAQNQNLFLGIGKYIELFSIVHFQMSPQIAFLRWAFSR